MSIDWVPPFALLLAGRQKTASNGYYNDASVTSVSRRILVKHTLAGEGILYVDGSRRLLKSGTIFVIDRPGPYAYCYEGKGEAWSFEYFSIGVSGNEEVLPLELRQNPVMDISDYPELKVQIKELVNLRSGPGYREDLRHSYLSYTFLMNYISARIQNRKKVPAVVADLVDYLNEHMNSSINIGLCCKNLGYTPEALIRLFKHSIGVTPGEYLRRQRLKEVCALLRESRLSVKEIALSCGFESNNYLGRVFKQFFGVTPGQYRKNPDLSLLEKISDNIMMH